MAKDKVFADHPNLKEYWKTSDGKPFYSENAAKNHARTLKDKHIDHVERKGSTVVDSKSKSKKENKETTEVEYDMGNSRSELNEIAKDFGVEKPEELETKQDVIDAIDTKKESQTKNAE